MIDSAPAPILVPRARAIRSIRDWIRSGQLPMGETLPSERALAQRLQVGRATIRRALQVLVKDGLIIDHGGHIRSIAPVPPPSDPAKQTGRILRTTIAIIPCPSAPQIAAGAMEVLLGSSMHALTLASASQETIDELLSVQAAGLIVTDPEVQPAASIPAVMFRPDGMCDRVWIDAPSAGSRDLVFSVLRGANDALSIDFNEVGRQLALLLLDRLAGRLPTERQIRLIQTIAAPCVEPSPQPAPILQAPAAPQRGATEPLFDWKMRSGRWKLAQPKV